MIVDDDRILLARFPTGGGGHVWVLPGGGVEHGEDPYDAVIRELEEETGYAVEVVGLLGVTSRRVSFPRSHWWRRPVDHHGMAVIYEARVVGGELRPEENGSTDLAGWHGLGELGGVELGSAVPGALRLWRERPGAGHVE